MFSSKAFLLGCSAYVSKRKPRHSLMMGEPDVKILTKNSRRKISEMMKGDRAKDSSPVQLIARIPVTVLILIQDF
jgi:hypothetical protein